MDSKNKQIDQIVTDIFIHEIKTPLTTVKLFSDFISSTLDTSKTKQSAHKISHQVDELTKIINYYRDWKRLSENLLIFNDQSYELEPLIKEIISPLSQIYPQLESQLHNLEPLSITTDRDRLAQIFEILLNRIIYYSPDTSTVYLNLSANDNNLLITVSTSIITLPSISATSSNLLPNPNTGLYFLYSLVDHYRGIYNFIKDQDRQYTFTIKLPLTHLLHS